MDKNPSYSQAIAEVEAILKRFEDENFDVDTLAAQVKRATELLKLCRTKLTRAESEVADALRQEE